MTTASLSSDAFEAFVRQLQRLDRDVAGVGVEVRAMQLARPAVAEVPADLILAAVVLQDDRTVTAIDIAVDDALPPLPELGVLGDAALEHDVRIPRQPRQL